MRKIATNELPSGSAGTARWISSLMIPCGTSSGTWWVLIMFECHIHTHTDKPNKLCCPVCSRTTQKGFNKWLYSVSISCCFERAFRTYLNIVCFPELYKPQIDITLLVICRVLSIWLSRLFAGCSPLRLSKPCRRTTYPNLICLHRDLRPLADHQ